MLVIIAIVVFSCGSFLCSKNFISIIIDIIIASAVLCIWFISRNAVIAIVIGIKYISTLFISCSSSCVFFAISRPISSAIGNINNTK